MATQHQNTCSLPESLRCYLLRGNTMVPLVPVDQLPFQLKGIPRQLTHRQMSDQGWKLFKETKDAPCVLSVQAPTTTSWSSHGAPDGKPQYLAPDHYVRTESQNVQMTLNRTGRSLQSSPAAVDTTCESLGTPFTTGVERQSSLTDAVASVYHKDAQRLGYTSSIGPDSSKKVYCTHWIATGECRWMHTGCKYKHEMPGTEKLRELGFTRGTPKWWKEKNAVSPAKSLTWMQRKMAGNEDMEQPNGDVPALRTFPSPLAFRRHLLDERDGASDEADKVRSVCKRQGPTAQSTASISSPPLPTPNLIDLDDMPIPPSSPSQSQISSAESSSSAAAPSSPHSDTSSSPQSPIIQSISSSLRSRKSKTAHTPRIQTHLPSPTPSSSSSSSYSSSSSSSSDFSDTDASPPPLPLRTVKSKPVPVIPPHQQQPKRRNKRDTNLTTAQRATVPEAKLSLASSKYAVNVPASAKVEREMHVGQSARKGGRKGGRAERSV